MKDIVAVVLAGGIGKRFWPLTTSKSLVDFVGKPLLWYNIELLKIVGFKDFIFVTPQDTQSFSLPEISGINFETVMQTKPLGFGDGLLKTEKLLKNRACLVVNADDFVEDKLYKNMKAMVRNEKPFIVGKKTKQYIDVGYLKIDNESVTDVIEKPGQDKVPSNLIKLVFDFFPSPQDLFEVLKKTSSQCDDVYEVALSKFLKTNRCRFLEYDGFWQSLKYPWNVLDLMDYFLNNKLVAHRGKNVEIRQNVIFEGPVWLGDNVRVFENTKIVGPCYIGDNTVIGNNNVIRYSQIGANCVTGFSTDITRSYIGENSWFHGNYVGDSIIDGNVSLGSGSVLANLRLDEREIYSVIRGQRFATGRNKLGAVIGRDVRIGVNTSVMPGMKIGGNSLIGAGLIIDKDIPENSFCLGKTELKIEKNVSLVPKKNREEFRRKF